jgi:hypothetical protein
MGGLPWIGGGLVFLTAVFFSSWAGNQPACQSGEPLSNSAQAMHELGYATSIGAFVCALLLLVVQRRWVAALLILVAGAVVYLFTGLEVAFRCD